MACMAHKSALDLVISQMIPVDPEGEQPAYFRSARSIQTSEDLIQLQQCVAGKMGDNYDDRAAVRQAFSSASNECS